MHLGLPCHSCFIGQVEAQIEEKVCHQEYMSVCCGSCEKTELVRQSRMRHLGIHFWQCLACSCLSPVSAGSTAAAAAASAGSVFGFLLRRGRMLLLTRVLYISLAFDEVLQHTEPCQPYSGLPLTTPHLLWVSSQLSAHTPFAPFFPFRLL